LDRATGWAETRHPVIYYGWLVTLAAAAAVGFVAVASYVLAPLLLLIR
jgi:hypothetical protein